MTTPPQNQTGSEICSIRIIFPVGSDEEAINYKKKIAEVIAPMPEARMQFSLMPMAKDMPIP